MLQFLLLVIALGGAVSTGYLVKANEMQLAQNNLQQQQLDAQERIRALEQQIAELQASRESGNRVELDLTEVFEPIRDAVGRIALVRMGEISREITTELTRLVEDDLPSLDDPANATGVNPGGMIGGASPDRTDEPEAASVADETAPPPSADGPNPLQPSSAALDVTEVPEAQILDSAAGEAEDAAPTATPAASNAPAVNETPVGATTAEAASQEASRDDAPGTTAGRSGIVNADGATAPEPEPAVVAELGASRLPSSPADVARAEP